MSSLDDERSSAREAAEALVGKIVAMREASATTREIADQLAIPYGRAQAIVGRLLRYRVIKPYNSRKGERQRILDFIDEKYGKNKQEN